MTDLPTCSPSVMAMVLGKAANERHYLKTLLINSKEHLELPSIEIIIYLYSPISLDNNYISVAIQFAYF